MRHIFIFLTSLLIFISCDYLPVKTKFKQIKEYEVTIRKNEKDSTFTIISTDTTEKYVTELWISDPECTECIDCYVNKGEIKIPKELKQFIDDKWLKDLYLVCNNPYIIEKEPYLNYVIKGQIIGVKYGRAVFCVTEWNR